jgi:hypothetical protein
LPHLTAGYSAGLGDLDHREEVEMIRFFGWGSLRGSSRLFHPRYVAVEAINQDRSVGILCSKLIVAIRLFLNTTAAWIARICDDTAINARTFSKFYRELNEVGNPFTERIIQGHVIDRSDLTYAYLQGGSGVFFSRFAAREMYEGQERFLNMCYKVYSDDRAIGRWLEARGVPPVNATNRWIVGHDYDGTRTPRDLLDLSKFEACPPHPPQGMGRPFFHRVRDVTFWHTHTHWLHFGTQVRKLQDEIPKELLFYNVGRAPVPCVQTPGVRTGYDDEPDRPDFSADD